MLLLLLLLLLLCTHDKQAEALPVAVHGLGAALQQAPCKLIVVALLQDEADLDKAHYQKETAAAPKEEVAAAESSGTEPADEAKLKLKRSPACQSRAPTCSVANCLPACCSCISCHAGVTSLASWSTNLHAHKSITQH